MLECVEDDSEFMIYENKGAASVQFEESRAANKDADKLMKVIGVKQCSIGLRRHGCRDGGVMEKRREFDMALCGGGTDLRSVVVGRVGA